MALPASVVVGSDAEVRDVGAAVLGRGNAVDAVVAGVFAAAGLYPSVLLGPVQLLLGGAGAGLRAVDGRNRQPGLGNPRPRGFLPDERVPDAARVGVPALPAALLAAATTYGKLSVAALLAPGLDLARGRSPARAAVLQSIAERGPAALADVAVSDELVALAGRLAGGLLSTRDLDELRPNVTGAKVEAARDRREVVTVPWSAAGAAGAAGWVGADAAAHSPHTRIVVAVDRNGLVAVACYEVPRDGLTLDAFELVAPFTAAPVLRGEPRVKPGEPRAAAAPIGLVQASGVLELGAGVGGGAEGSAEAQAQWLQWLRAYRPMSELERGMPLPSGLVGVQRAGTGWSPL